MLAAKLRPLPSQVGAAGAAPPPVLLVGTSERPLLRHRPGVVVSIELESELGRSLCRVAASGLSNLQTFSAGILHTLLPALLPAAWRGLESAELAAEPEAVAAGAEALPSLGWLLEVWEFLGREHSQAPLSRLCGWPLLPAEGSVLRALRSSFSRVGGVGGSFEGVDLLDRRSLRAMLSAARHTEERELRADASLVPLLRSLPIYEVYRAPSEGGEGVEAEGGGEGVEAEEAAAGSDGAPVVESSSTALVASSSDGADDGPADGSACVGLSVEVHRLPPEGVSSSLLDGRFVRCVCAGEEGLVRFAGIAGLSRAGFYREHVFPRVGELRAAQRDGAMLAALHSLHALCEADDGFLGAVRELAFVPVGSGALRRARIRDQACQLGQELILVQSKVGPVRTCEKCPAS